MKTALFDQHRYHAGHIYEDIKEENEELIIRDTNYNGVDTRLYEVNGVRESASFFGKRKYDLVFDYMKSFQQLIELIPECENVLLIGGAGFSYPKYFISQYPDKFMDVVEMEERSIQIAKKYFFLNDLEEEFHAFSNKRLQIYIDEAVHFLETTRKKYDLIINDAYHSDDPDMGLYTDYVTSLIREHLYYDGVYGANLITGIAGHTAMRGMVVQEMLMNRFNWVDITPCTKGMDPTCMQNCLVTATDREIR